ncbi:unconventional prefoldin RPB5 interactor isoform X2 [Oratosquilla oratoria]
MVPIGKRAFMPGHLVHTNEVLVLLGDNWFAERSAKQAVEIVGRRIKDCHQKTEDLLKIKKMHNNWLKEVCELKEEAMGDQVEIVEEITEEEYQAMKEKRSKANTASQSGESKKEAEKDEDVPQEWGSKSFDQKSFDDLLKRLDELEMEEEEKDELANMDRDSDDEDMESESSDEEEQEEVVDPKNSDVSAKRKIKRRVSWVEGLVTEVEHSEKQDKVISIYYTSRRKVVEDASKDSGSHKKSVKEIESPADIYEVFCSEKESSVSKPKGILKKRSYVSFDEDSMKVKDTDIADSQKPMKAGWLNSTQSVEIVTEYEEEPLPPSPVPSPPPKEIQSLEPAFSYKVVEHEARAVGCKSEAVTPPEEDEVRPQKVSRFKASRMKK